jgi:small subunit ribosomal protein S20
LANSPQARKRARQNDNRRAHNASLRSLVRTKIKRVLAAIATGDQTAAAEAYTAAVPVIDRMANKGIISKNKAARHKSRLNTKVKALAG